MLVDDHDVVRAGFSRLLEASGRCQIVAEARSAEEALEKYGKIQPDVVVMDMSMPGLGGLEGVRRIRSHDDSARILVLTVHESEPFPQKAIEAGALGYLTKRCAPEELLEAVDSVGQGKEYYATNIRTMLEAQRNRQAIEPAGELTRRELQIYESLAKGNSVAEIAETFHLSVKTVHTHRANLMRKLEVRNHAELALRAVKDGIVAN
ncbi:response regulator [Pokkaliibacter sp. CJK22405]|uniref:response regulator n=1 Tax=Pokkaliibacter sp. CJK22405 TaxID=3384615 RepID=UPI003984F2E7